MDNRLFELVHEDTPRFNEAILNGIAYQDIRSAKQYIDKIIRCAEQQYPKGLVYVGSKRCDPYEEYKVVTYNTKSNNKSNNRIYDMAHSDVYLVKYEFTYHGEKLDPQYLYLPYVRKGGLIYIGGKQFSISPVLADKLFSVGLNDVFIPMPRGKVTFNYETYSYIEGGDPKGDGIVINGKRVSKHVAWSPLHNRGAKKNKTAKSTMIQLGRVHSTLMHYLLCKFGFEETFLQYGGVKVDVINDDEATVEKYPEDKWVICRSAKMKPKTVRLREATYRPIASQVALVIPRDGYTSTVESMVSGFYYVVDHFPDSMEADYVHMPFQWKVLMGYILFGDEPGQGKLVEDVEAHLKSLDGYVDLDVTENLKSEGIECRHIYDLFGYIIENMTSMLQESVSKVGSMYGKQLMVLRYVLKDINNSIFEFLFKLTSNNKKIMTKAEMNKLVSFHFRARQILNLNSGKGHGEVSSVSSPNDNMFFKITSNLIQQSDTAGKGKGRETKPIDATMYLDGSFAEAGGYCVLPKSSPIGNTRLNPSTILGPYNVIERNPKYRDLIDSVQAKIKRK
jgi:hypothetical protein